MTAIVTYTPKDGDGDSLLELLRSAALINDELYREIMLNDLGPAFQSLLNRRAKKNAPDVEFFAALSEALGDLVNVLALFVCDSGQKDFVQTMLTSICVIAAAEHGIDVVPTREEVSNVIRSALN